MHAVAFLADMNISPITIKHLRESGWDIVRVSDFLPATAEDEEILSFAREQDRAVITCDLDFSDILALGGHRSPNLVTLRLSVGDPDTVTSRLLDVLPGLEEQLREGVAVTVEDTRVRMRELPVRDVEKSQ